MRRPFAPRATPRPPTPQACPTTSVESRAKGRDETRHDTSCPVCRGYAQLQHPSNASECGLSSKVHFIRKQGNRMAKSDTWAEPSGGKRNPRWQKLWHRVSRNQEEVNCAHTRQRSSGERAKVHLKRRKNLHKTHCCRHRATDQVKAVLVLPPASKSSRRRSKAESITPLEAQPMDTLVQRVEPSSQQPDSDGQTSDAHHSVTF